MKLIFHHSYFEQEVRAQLKIFDRDITAEDALRVTELDLTEFSFEDEDIETLFCFSNLTSLAINIREKGCDFWSHFVKLEKLYWCCWGYKVDFSVFSNLKQLTSLMVSGGDYSNINFLNLDAIIPLNHLEELILHEFGPVDLAPLENMPQLRRFSLLYTHSAKNIETIGKLHWLESLTLCGLSVDNLDFLDSLPDCLELDVCGIEIRGRKEIDVRKWKRFQKREICEIEVKDPCWEHIDLSALENG